MKEGFSIKRLFLVLPLIYIGIGWYIGVNYSKSVTFGPYPDIPVAVKTSLLGTSLSDIISGSKAILMVVPIKDAAKGDTEDTSYFKRTGYFEVPGSWDFHFNYAGIKKTFALTGGYSRAICHDSYNPNRSLGSLSVEEFNDFLIQTGRSKDAEKLKPYLILSRFERKCPYIFGGTVLLSNAMGNTFNDYMIPYDVLGLVGIGILVIALMLCNFRLWLYYLLWVASIWFARIGYHDPALAFTNEGWQVITWSLWHGFIVKEGRVFLVMAFLISILGFSMWGYMYFIKHILPRKRRQMEDLLKVDRETDKRKELSVETVEFKTLHYDINKKLSQYAKTDKYFLGISDKSKDIIIEENMLTHHLHVLGPTGSGKTSLVILPLAKQAIDRARGACFIDFKGDDVFKKYVQERARLKGKKFYYFSIDPDEESIGYNPLSSGDIHSKVDRIMTALELIYQGPAGFYSNVQTMVFVELLKAMAMNKQEINFSSIRDQLSSEQFLIKMKADPQEIKGLLAAISWIAGIDVINKAELNLSKAIKNGDIVFFALKSQVNTRLAEAIGRMLIIDLKSQAVSRKEIDDPYFIFIDEFQNLACPHFVDVISKVRSAAFCLILSNQSRGNLSSISRAFENAIFTNTATKVIFMQEDPDDARFWSNKTGATTYQDKNILQIDTMKDDRTEGAKVDGLRSSQANIRTAMKPYVSENVFLRLPFTKSVVFLRGDLASITNHEFLFDKKERDRLIITPFEYKAKENIQNKEEGPCREKLEGNLH